MVESTEAVLKEVCYYKLLGLEVDATYDDIRRKYRERALEFHPDKRAPEEREDCTEIFQKIQQAYECLSNDETRKWYDKNRHLITKTQRTSETTEFDIWSYFGVCYSGFDESKKDNFFEIYRKCFEKIAELEIEELQYEPDLELDEFPGFGTSQSHYKDVNDFYTFWQNFATIRTFVYDELWQIEGRMHRRYFERKVKKEQNKHRKEFNDNVRNLANHIKSLDPRILRFKKEQEEVKVQKLLEKMKIQEKVYEMKHVVKSEIINNMKENIMAIEKHKEAIQKQDAQRVFASHYEPDPEPAEEEFYSCNPCHKIFRSKNQLENHLKSKQHIKTLKSR